MYYVNNIINTIVGFIFLAILFTVTFAMPAVMTIWNIISLTPKKDMIKHRRRKDIATLLLGLLLTIIMLGLMSSYHWDEPVIIGGDFFPYSMSRFHRTMHCRCCYMRLCPLPA